MLTIYQVKLFLKFSSMSACENNFFPELSKYFSIILSLLSINCTYNVNCLLRKVFQLFSAL